MNYVISVVHPLGANIMQKLCEEMGLPIVLSIPCRGTATKSMLDLLGMESKDRRLFMTVASPEQTKQLIQEQRKRLYIDAPGNGITVSVPIKSVGGSKTLAFLSNGQNVKGLPTLNYDYELIMIIANQGATDQVMDAARSAGARGGTVIHGLGTGSKNAEKFYKVSIAAEKEVILIVSAASQKAAIMKAIIEQAGPDTKAGAIAFSLPVSELAGFGIAQPSDR
ncbi:MAG: P-II family nitrogen regulator [Clostridia bacterium]|nr:P-II family nitrogen regulator [Clostridia bacterium]